MTGSGALLGAVLGVRVIPLILLAPISGVAADRFNRRRLMQTSQALAATVSFAVGAALALGIVSIWMLFIFTLLMGASNVTDRPARLTTAFDLVPRDAAVKAVTLNTIGFSVMRVIGPAAAGYLIAWVGAAGCFFIQGALYAASGLVVLAIVFPPRQKPGRSALADMMEGLRFAFSDRSMRILIAIGALPYLLLVPVWGTPFPDLRERRLCRRARRSRPPAYRRRARRHTGRLHRQCAGARAAPGAHAGGLGSRDGARHTGRGS